MFISLRNVSKLRYCGIVSYPPGSWFDSLPERYQFRLRWFGDFHSPSKQFLV